MLYILLQLFGDMEIKNENCILIVITLQLLPDIKNFLSRKNCLT